MAQTILGNLWVSGLKNGTDSAFNMKNFVNILANFIQNNTIINGTFNGVTASTPPVASGPIPTVSKVNTSSLMNQAISCSLSSNNSDGSAEWLSWINSLYNLIATTVLYSGGTDNPVTPLPIFPTMITPSWSRNDLKSVLENNSKDPQGDCMDIIARGIVKDLKLNYLKSPIAATYANFTGTTVINAINISN